MNSISGRHVIAAALVIGAAVVAGSLIVSTSVNRMSRQLDRAAGQLDDIRGAVADAKDAIESLEIGAAAPNRQARRGPDPNKRYEVDTEGAPVWGPEKAPITIVEFSDFQ